MCSIILRLDGDGVLIGANRDEMAARPWQRPAEYWPGVVGGRDTLAGGTWMGVNRDGVMAAVLNRRGSLGPAPGKRSRGDLPLLALAHGTAAAAADAIAKLDAATYRSFNLVIADADGGFFLAGLEHGSPALQPLGRGIWMVTSGAPNDRSMPRIARHLPLFEVADFAAWPRLLADRAPPAASALNIAERNGFATVCASVMSLPRQAPPVWLFAAGPPDLVPFTPVNLISGG